MDLQFLREWTSSSSVNGPPVPPRMDLQFLPGAKIDLFGAQSVF